MRVLMFGWEFPPHIAGGLGTACYGMTRGLARNGVEVIFVMPRAFGDEDQSFVRVVNASDVETQFAAEEGGDEEFWKKLSFIQIDSNMIPYVSPEEFALKLDSNLQSLNSDYEAKRFKSIALECLEVIPAKSGIFDDWLRDHNKLGGQHKIPRLYNQRDIIEDILQYNR